MTELVPVAELPAPVPVVVSSPPPFGAALASVIFFLYLAAQAVASVAAVIVVIIVILATTGGSFPSTDSLLAASMPVAVILSFIGGAIAVGGATLLWARPLRSEAGPRGLGWRRGTARQQLFAVLAAIAIAAAWTSTASYLIPPPSTKQLGPMMQIMSGHDWGRYAVAFAAVVLAPPVEELLFRGVLLAGYVRRFGLMAGSIVTTVLFVLLHLGETFHYLPALAMVTIVGIALLLIRLRTDSIFVSMIFHASYNAAVMIVSLRVLPV